MFKNSHSLKAVAEEKIAEYYVHKLLVVNFDKMPLIFAFFEDCKAKVFEANAFTKLQDIRFISDYGVAKAKEKKVEAKDKGSDITSKQMLILNQERGSHENYSRQSSRLSRLESSHVNLRVGTGVPQDYLAETNLESIAEKVK